MRLAGSPRLRFCDALGAGAFYRRRKKSAPTLVKPRLTAEERTAKRAAEREAAEKRLQEILPARRAQNLQVWNGFLRNGWDQVWSFINERECTCPDLNLHPVDFKRVLHLEMPGQGVGREPGNTKLERLLRERLKGIDRRTLWHKKARKILSKADHARSRWALLVLACPLWADRSKIRAIYRRAREKTQQSGIKHSVDHIVPLKGRNVCGLHVQHNLRVIPQTDNSRKGNAFCEMLALTAQSESCI